MPVSITKANVSHEIIQQMVFKAFECEAEKIEELIEGFFNVVYKIQLSQEDVILKIAPSPDVELMTYEKDIMASEVVAMQKVGDLTAVPVPKILFCDDTHTLCPSAYFL